MTRSRQDLVILGAATIGSYGLAVLFDLVEKFVEWTGRYESWEVDEIIFAAFVFAFGCAWVLARRLERRRSEETPRAGEERFRNLIEGSVQGIIVQRDWKPLFINQAYADLFGYDSPDEILAMDSIEPQFAPYERERLRRYMAAQQRGEPAPTQYEYDMVRKDGSVITVQNVVRVVDWEGEPAVQSILVDVTERTRAEEALRQSEERYRNLIEGSVQGIVIDRNRQPIFVNQSFADILDYDAPEEILAMASLDPCVAPHERPRLKRYTEARLKGKQAPTQYEYNALRKDGSIATLQNVVRVITWEGEPAIQNTVIDITVRKRVEDALRQSEQRLKLAIDGADLGTWDWNIETGIVTYNRRLGRLLSAEPSAFEVAVNAWRERIHPDDITHAMAKLNAHMKGETTFCESEYRLKTRSGDWRWVLDRGTVVERDKDGRPLRASGTTLDITDRKRTEEQTRHLLHRNQSLAKHLIVAQEEERKYLARELHDELGQSLTAIKTYAAVIADRSKDADQQTYDNARGITSVVSNIYDAVYSMMRRLRPNTLDQLGLGDTVNSIVKNWQSHHRRIPCQLTVSGELDDLGEAINITVCRVIQECLTNVVRHAAASHVNITLERYSGQQANGEADGGFGRCAPLARRRSGGGGDDRYGAEPQQDTLLLVIEDSGRGMDIERVQKSANGFGLLGVRERLETIGGEFALESELGQGVRINIRIPVRDSR